MGNIVNDIVEEIEIKPNKNKLILKWVISIAASLIGLAFVLGQFKTSFFNRMDGFEDALNQNTASIERMETKMDKNFVEVNTRIDKGYDDGMGILQDYQDFNKKQLILVLDYGQSNKELLKEMLELNSKENARSVENQIEQSKNQEIKPPYKGEVEFIPIIEDDLGVRAFMNEILAIETETKDTIFSLVGATKNYINGIDKNRYEVGPTLESNGYPGRYDVSYRKKR